MPSMRDWGGKSPLLMLAPNWPFCGWRAAQEAGATALPVVGNGPIISESRSELELLEVSPPARYMSVGNVLVNFNKC